MTEQRLSPKSLAAQIGPITVTPTSAHTLRALHAAHPDPVAHSLLDRRAVHRLVRDGRLVRYAYTKSVYVIGANRLDPHYALTERGLAVAAALPDVIPGHPFTVHEEATS